MEQRLQLPSMLDQRLRRRWGSTNDRLSRTHDARFLAGNLVQLLTRFPSLVASRLATAIVVVIFGGLTLILQDDTFIKLKPTIINSLFGGVLLGGLLFNKSLIGYVLDSVFSLTDEGWRKLTFRWGLFFFFLAALNEVAWRVLSTDDCVTFKVFGVMPITFVFTLTQLLLYCDTLIYGIFRYHFNGMVWNVLTTPGADESVHVSHAEVGLVFGAAPLRGGAMLSLNVF